MKNGLLSVLFSCFIGLICGESSAQPIQSCPPPCINPTGRLTADEFFHYADNCGAGNYVPPPLSYDSINSECYADFLEDWLHASYEAMNSIAWNCYIGASPYCGATNTCCQESTIVGDGFFVTVGGVDIWHQNCYPVSFPVYCADCEDRVYSVVPYTNMICAMRNYQERIAFTKYAFCVNWDIRLPGTPNPICTLVDFNMDGGVDGNDVALFMAEYADGLSTADVNGDGGVDGSDLALFMSTWENGGC